MDGGKGSSPPPAPDFSSLARQGAISTSRFSNPNLSTPFGSRTVDWSSGYPSVSETWDPRLMQAAGQMFSTAGKPLDFSGTPKVFGSGDLIGARDQVTNALYNRATSMLDPQWARAEENQRTMLANQGFSPNSAGFNTQMDAFQRQKGLQYQNARDTAIAGGSGELSRLSDISMNQHRQAISDILQQRGVPLRELGSLMGLGPRFNSWNPVQDPQLAAGQSSYQGDLTRYGIETGQRNAFMNGLMNLGGMWALGGFKMPGGA